jgi:2-polyprenyl-3-methyl-5-hydroxy-6-metoxy-1,4-benzoquinol methylase
MNNDILQEQIEYYHQRASEYDEWFLRQGRYDRGEIHRQQWFSEVSQVKKAFFDASPSGDILELACGTGLWTQHLAPLANYLTAIDASSEAIALNQKRVGSSSIEYIGADLFDWESDRQFDFIFFGFWRFYFR